VRVRVLLDDMNFKGRDAILAAQVITWMDEGVLPVNSYKVLLDEDGNLQWVTNYEGREACFDTDPESNAWQRFVTGFIRMLPVENQL
jgi:putative cardiolipin synthase